MTGDSFLTARNLNEVELAPDDFVSDQPYPAASAKAFDEPQADPRLIEGVSMRSLGGNVDGRGHLVELFSQRRPGSTPRVHVYQVFAEPGSIRAWVFHRHQTDFLSFTERDFQVALYDIRADCPTYKRLNVFRIGARRPTSLCLPPYVVHGVCNLGPTTASFLNMPDAVWRSDKPDKHRLRYPDPRLPFHFG